MTNTIVAFLVMLALALLGMASANAQQRSPFIISDSTDHPAQPNYCAWYFDGSIEAVKEPTALDDDGFPYCIYDVSDISVGTHTVTAAYVVDTPWQYEEGPQSAPFGFDRPADAVGLPAPVLRFGDF